MRYEEILSSFKVVSRSGSSAKCICPAHADKEASLSISKGRDGKTLIKCFAGCETTDILGAVGLELKDLFDEPITATGEKWKAYVEKREKRQIEGVYNYQDLSGQYAFTRLRLSGKKFIYGQLSGDRFTYGLNGKTRKSIPAIFSAGVTDLKKAIANGKTVFYCEGEKDVLTVNKHGLTGVTCGASGDWVPGCTTLFSGADVVILQDNDAPGEKSSKAIEADLRTAARSVKIVVPTPDLEHGDISDFFESHGVEDLEKLIEAAETKVVDEAPDLDRFHLIGTNGKVTGVFDLAIFNYIKATEDLFILGGVPFIYEGGVFRPDPSGSKLKTMIRGLIYPEYVRSTTLKRIYDLFISDQELQARAEDLNAYPVEWINFQNGFYDPREKKLIPHDPKYKAVNQIPHFFHPERGLKGTRVPEWLTFICDGNDDISMLTEYAGLCLTRDTRQQKFLILCGEGGSGKSTVIRMIDRMIGSENISNISLCQLTQRFSAYGLMGKLLNSCADLEIDALSDVSTLKKVLGEDTLSAEAKGKDAISFKSYAKLIFSTNELPIVKAEKTNGFYRRLLILTMNRIPERKETDFFDRLSAEIDDFIWIVVMALEKLYQRGAIMESLGSVEAVKRLRCDSDTVEAFLNDQVVRSQAGRIKKLDLYRTYEDFCRDMERQSLTKQNFYRSMKTKGFGEIKTGGTEYFRGINYRGNLPEESPQISLNEWTTAKAGQVPFD